jgi:hypothetical protein
MILWESTDRTVRLCAGRPSRAARWQSAFKKAPDLAVIPCTFNMEMPVGGAKPFEFWGAQSRG